MKEILVIPVFCMLLLNVTLAFADGDHQNEIEEGKGLAKSKISCDELNDEQLEAIGEYFMEQMHPGESHEAMHKMMGVEEGTGYHKQFHVNIAKIMYCGESGMMGSGGMMGMMPMMNMTGGNMVAGQNLQTNMMQGMRGNWGYGFGYWNFINVLYVISLIGVIVLVYLWIVKLLRMQRVEGAKNEKRR